MELINTLISLSVLGTIFSLSVGVLGVFLKCLLLVAGYDP